MTLFGEASTCAYPDCDQPLIFTDRGKKTAVAEIAHIRSEAPGGPRYDADYTDDVDGPDNLLLLCGSHHKPVEGHERAYTVAELEGWKASQRSTAGSGTSLSMADVRSYVRLTSEDRQALYGIARLVQHVLGLAKGAQQGLLALRQRQEEHRLSEWATYPFSRAYSVEDDGTKTYGGSNGFSLSFREQEQQQAEFNAMWLSHQDSLQAALALLDEEVAVLRMTFGGAVASLATRIAVTAAAIPVVDNIAFAEGVEQVEGLVSQLWRLANGEVDSA